MGADIELMQAQRQIRELVVAMGRQEARAGELAAEIAIVRQEAADVKAENELLMLANGCLQERLAALEDRFRKHCANQQMGVV
jgi:regulator of replication initiation timing